MTTVEKLKFAYQELTRQDQPFEPGEVVDWKPGFRNRRTSGPFIVTGVLSDPFFDGENSSGSAYFREPLDLRLARFEEESGDFIEHYYDSRRFERA